MTRVYTPDSWVIVELGSVQYGKVYKVLASWYGGFTGADSWKLSSGIESLSFDGARYTMPQISGSTYECHQNNMHMSGIMESVYSSFAERIKNVQGTSIKIIDIVELSEALRTET